jgi:hypothetical protein
LHGITVVRRQGSPEGSGSHNRNRTGTTDRSQLASVDRGQQLRRRRRSGSSPRRRRVTGAEIRRIWSPTARTGSRDDGKEEAKMIAAK